MVVVVRCAKVVFVSRLSSQKRRKREIERERRVEVVSFEVVFFSNSLVFQFDLWKPFE